MVLGIGRDDIWDGIRGDAEKSRKFAKNNKSKITTTHTRIWNAKSE